MRTFSAPTTIEGALHQAHTHTNQRPVQEPKTAPYSQALEDDVDAEIARMASEGVIEPCNDPKGFNSPVFAVRKKNGKIRVVANFKRTLNKVLVDLDPYPIPTIDSTFNKIGEGNKYFSHSTSAMAIGKSSLTNVTAIKRLYLERTLFPIHPSGFRSNIRWTNLLAMHS